MSASDARVAHKVPPRWLIPFFRQFGHPRGLLGRVALNSMAKRNRAVNEWVLDVLEVATGDLVLDVGCGPGFGMQLAAERGATVAGVDVSAAAVARAQRGNPEGRARVAPADALPFDDAEFTVVLSVNSMGFWPDPEAGVREIHRVLAPGGRLAVALRMKVDGVKATDRRAYGSTPDQIGKVENLLRHVGFTSVERHEAHPGEEHTTAVVGHRG